VIVAVLDTGIDRTHAAFAGRSVLTGRDFVDGDTDPAERTDGIDNDADGVTDEGFGHGTFVAGLVSLTAPGATILPVRVLDTEGRGRASAIAAGIAWAVEQGADVINLSFGADQSSPLLGDAVRAALNRGVFVIASSGNGGVRTGIDFPASVAGVVAIGGTDERGAPAAFSDGIGSTVTVAAPAVGIVGPLPGGFGRADGTSFAAAFASGGAALRLETTPAPLPGRQPLVFRTAVRPAPKAISGVDRRRLGAGRLDLPRLLR
jgi:subtilisin family serine protease